MKLERAGEVFFKIYVGVSVVLVYFFFFPILWDDFFGVCKLFIKKILKKGRGRDGY